MDFSGGLNSEMSNEQLRENEYTTFENVDLDGINPRLRSGRIRLGTAGTSGFAQGMFFFYQINAIAPHIIVAAFGRLYRIVAGNSIEIPITDGTNPFTFQTDRTVEAVQYRETLYIATGTKLVELWIDTDDTFKARTITPYTPTVMEAIYIGTNAMADNPSGYIQDGTASVLALTGIQPDRQKSAINLPVEFTAFIDKRVSYSGTHDFKWEYKKTAETDFKLISDWQAGHQVLDMKFTELGPFDIKATVRESAAPLSLAGRPITAYNTVSPNQVETNLIDGLDTTYLEMQYNSATGYTSQFMIDLGSVKQINQITLKHYGAYLKATGGTYTNAFNTNRWRIRTSNDNSTYTDIKTVTGNVDDITNTAVDVSCRYLMIIVEQSTQTPSTGNTKIVELQVWGPPSVDSKQSTFTLSNYAVNSTDSTADIPTDGIRQCNKIVLHWDRLILYGDPLHPYQIYVSDLTNPYYWPTTNTIMFNTGKLEAITSITRFQDLLLIFTKTTIQTLTGKSPDDYARYQIHDGLGAVAGWSVKVVGNNVMFLSHEGVMLLKPNPYRLESMNVSRADRQVKSEMPTDSDACAIVTQGQYWLCFPQKRIIYRFYYERGVWVKDVNPDSLHFRQFLLYGEDIYNLTLDAKLLRHDPNVYTDDDYMYSIIVESKHLDFSSSFNQKKLKRLYVLARHYKDHNIDLYVTVKADSAIALTPEHGQAVITEDGFVEWQYDVTPNMHFYTGTTLGLWTVGQSSFGEALISVQKASVRGKCRRTKIRFEYKGGQPFEFYGFGFEFRLKKP
jgi:hypothetical protein